MFHCECHRVRTHDLLERLLKYPREYAPLAYLLAKSAFPVNRVYPTKGSDLEKTIKARGRRGSRLDVVRTVYYAGVEA
jgi:hypothetical protein